MGALIGLEHQGKYRVRRKSDGQYLVSPIDAWGRVAPAWTPIPEAAMRFSKNGAEQQCDFLCRRPHHIIASKTLSTEMGKAKE